MEQETTKETETIGDSTAPFQRLSKKEKRALKTQKRKDTRKERKQEAKIRKKEKKKSQNSEGLPLEPKKKKKRKWEEIEWSPQRIVIDLGFDEDMLDSEIISLSQQIRLCYSINHQQTNPHQLFFTSFGGKTKDHCFGWEQWKVKIEPKSYMELFEKDSLVYLTADSTNVCDDLDPTKVYIIGGIVDHNRLKGITLKKANEQGIATAQLPIGKFVQMASRKVLTVNHVFEVLVNYKRTNSWETAFQKALPKRKMAQIRTDTEQTPTNDPQPEEQDELEPENLLHTEPTGSNRGFDLCG